MKLERHYNGVIFPVDAVIAAATKLREIEPKLSDAGIRSVERDLNAWNFDSDEEFIADYRSGPFERAYYTIGSHKNGLTFSQHGSGRISLDVRCPSRPDLMAVVTTFENYLDRVTVVEKTKGESTAPEPLKVFIGHGRDPQWRDLKDHLQDQHGIPVDSFESGARAGHVVRDILSELLVESTFAVLVMTGEDATEDGGLRARQNVVHEAGLFQGRLGFPKAIIVVEEGVEVFSNLDGIQQIYFPKGRIRESFGDVVATIRREFPSS